MAKALAVGMYGVSVIEVIFNLVTALKFCLKVLGRPLTPDSNLLIRRTIHGSLWTLVCWKWGDEGASPATCPVGMKSRQLLDVCLEGNFCVTEMQAVRYPLTHRLLFTHKEERRLLASEPDNCDAIGVPRQVTQRQQTVGEVAQLASPTSQLVGQGQQAHLENGFP